MVGITRTPGGPLDCNAAARPRMPADAALELARQERAKRADTPDRYEAKFAEAKRLFEIEMEKTRVRRPDGSLRRPIGRGYADTKPKEG